MKVWLAFAGEYEERACYGVFDSEEKAARMSIQENRHRMQWALGYKPTDAELTEIEEHEVE